MDKRGSEIFKNLVANGGKMPENLQNDYGFSFQTVFHTTSRHLTYCCCTCAFEHEYFDYIDKTGNINQNVLDRIVKCVRNGACPHVYMAPEECVTKTSVNGLHVVAALGSEERLVWYLKNISHATAITSGVFKLQPYLITLLKNKRIVMNTGYNILRQYQLSLLAPNDFQANTRFLYAQRSPENCQTIRIQKMSISEVCVQHRSTAMLKYIFKTIENQHPKFSTYKHTYAMIKPKLAIASVYEMAYRQGLIQGEDFIPVIQEIFVRKLPCIQYRDRANNDEFARNELDKFIETIVVCNQPEVLDCLFKETGLEMKCRCSIQAQSGKEECSYCKSYKTCVVLGRTECEKVIERHHRMDLPNTETMALERISNNLKQTREYTAHDAENPNGLETVRNKTGTQETNFPNEIKTDIIKGEVDNSMQDTGTQNENLISADAKMKKLLSLIIDHPYSKDDIKDALKTLPNLSKAIKATVDVFLRSPLRRLGGGLFTSMPLRSISQPVSRQGPSTENNYSTTENIEILRTLLDIGDDIDCQKGNGNKMLCALLCRKLTNWQYTEIEYRQIIELFLYANPSVDNNMDVVDIGLKVDLKTVNDTDGHQGHTFRQRLAQLSSRTIDKGAVTPWTYVMDAKEHFFFSENPSTVCFNFTGPLLLECGFPISHLKLQGTLNKPHHPEVKIYLQQCYDIPRPLKHCCRDVLRKYCKGRKIHEFVNRSHIPGSIKDFILLKTVLHTLQS